MNIPCKWVDGCRALPYISCRPIPRIPTYPFSPISYITSIQSYIPTAIDSIYPFQSILFHINIVTFVVVYVLYNTCRFLHPFPLIASMQRYASTSMQPSSLHIPTSLHSCLHTIISTLPYIPTIGLDLLSLRFQS